MSIDEGALKPKKRERAVGREVACAAVKRESKVRGALDAELHHDRFDENLLSRRIQALDDAL